MGNRAEVIDGRIVITGGEVDEEKRAARLALRELDEALGALTTGWAGATQAARIEAVRRGVVIALKAVRWLAMKG